MCHLLHGDFSIKNKCSRQMQLYETVLSITFHIYTFTNDVL